MGGVFGRWGFVHAAVPTDRPTDTHAPFNTNAKRQQVVGEGSINLQGGKTYKLSELCLEPKTWQVR